MVLLSVVVIAITGAAYAYVPAFRGGVGQLAHSVCTILDTGAIAGVGVDHGGGSCGASSNPHQQPGPVATGPDTSAAPLGVPPAPTPVGPHVRPAPAANPHGPNDQNAVESPGHWHFNSDSYQNSGKYRANPATDRGAIDPLDIKREVEQQKHDPSSSGGINLDRQDS